METLKTIRLCAVAALAVFTITACSDNDDTPVAPENELLVTKMERKVKYVLEDYENFFADAKNDITEMKYDSQGRLIEWMDNGKCAGYFTYEKGKLASAMTHRPSLILYASMTWSIPISRNNGSNNIRKIEDSFFYEHRI